MKTSIKAIVIALSLATTMGTVNAASEAKSVSPYTPHDGYSKQESAQLISKFDINTYQNIEDVTRYVYLNMPQFFPNNTIARTGQVSQLATKIDENIGKIEAQTPYGKISLDEWTEDHMDGVIVIYKGEVVYEKYPRMQPTDKHIWWSVSKSMAGTLVAMLEAKGQVDVKQPIEKYIPELKGTDWAGTTVIDILDMTSGMTGLEADDPEAYTNPKSPYGLYESSLGLVAKTDITMDSTYDYIASLKRQKPAGQKHEYTSVNTFVLGWLVEKMTGQSYADVISEQVWQHIGAESDANLMVSKSGAPGSHGAISSTLRDLGRYGMLFTPSWNQISQHQVISNNIVERFQTAGRPENIKAGMGFDYFNDYFMGDLESSTYQWDAVTTDKDFAKAGFHGQTLYISPSKDLVVASFATNSTYSTFTFARTLAKSLK
ncbi:MAG: serine hydrolase domain-containing protein [Psychromonas sp.]